MSVNYRYEITKVDAVSGNANVSWISTGTRLGGIL